MPSMTRPHRSPRAPLIPTDPSASLWDGRLGGPTAVWDRRPVGRPLGSGPPSAGLRAVFRSSIRWFAPTNSSDMKFESPVVHSLY